MTEKKPSRTCDHRRKTLEVSIVAFIVTMGELATYSRILLHTCREAKLLVKSGNNTT